MRLVQVTPVYVPPVLPAMRARLSVSFSLPSGAYTTLPFDVTDYDISGDFNTGTHTWSCSETGHYLVIIAAAVWGMTEGAPIGINLFWDGVVRRPFKIDTTGADGVVTVSVSDVLEVTAGESAVCQGFQFTGANKTVAGSVGSGTFWVMRKLP